MCLYPNVCSAALTHCTLRTHARTHCSTYSYDNGVKPYSGDNWRLLRHFSTILLPGVLYTLGMKSFPDGRVVHSLFASSGALLEEQTNQHEHLCADYQQGQVNGLYFGGTCTAPLDVSVTYTDATSSTNNPASPAASVVAGALRAAPRQTAAGALALVTALALAVP